MEENNVFVERPVSAEVKKEENVTYASKPVNNIYRDKYAKMQEIKVQKGIEAIASYGWLTLVYAILTTICLYKCYRGISFPIYVGITIAYYILVFKQTGIEYKASSLKYIIAMGLLGISVFLTEDKAMTGLAKWTLLLLLLLFGIHNVFDMDEWNLFSNLKVLGIYLLKICENIGDVFIDFANIQKRRREDAKKKASEGIPVKRTGKITYVLIGIAVSVPLLIVVLNLLCKADAVFKDACDAILELIDIKNVVCVTLMTIIVYILFYSIVKFLYNREAATEEKDRRTNEPIIAITVASILSVVYILFCLIQVLYVFMGVGDLPVGYTYAEYVHEGFYELLAVCIINLVIVLIATNLFRKHKVLDGVVTLICVCTYIMIASSAYRMILYIGAYDLTKLRVIVLWSLIVITVLMIGVTIAIYKERFRLFKYGITTIVVAVIVLVYSHPDAIVTQYNINQCKASDYSYKSIDIDYILEDLSIDAAAVLFEDDNYLTVIKYYEENDIDTKPWYDYTTSFSPELADYHQDLLRYMEDDGVYIYKDHYEDEKELVYRTQRMNIRNFNVSKLLARNGYVRHCDDITLEYTNPEGYDF